jgi:cytochrome oxidase Cu insertion factor (SCO1/SenC/PrrC family)
VSPRAKLALLGAVCAAPFILGTAAYVFDWAPDRRANYGELVTPRPLSGAPLDALRGKWVLISFDAATCDAYCERKLYLMRQVRAAQGKDAGRVERVWALTDTARPRAELLGAIEGTHVVPLKGASALQGFPGDATDHIYVIDPLGNLMMRFPREPDPSKMLKDVQRLLRLSQIG